MSEEFEAWLGRQYSAPTIKTYWYDGTMPANPEFIGCGWFRRDEHRRLEYWRWGYCSRWMQYDAAEKHIDEIRSCE